jgi:hypothetical protein
VRVLVVLVVRFQVQRRPLQQMEPLWVSVPAIREPDEQVQVDQHGAPHYPNDPLHSTPQAGRHYFPDDG